MMARRSPLQPGAYGKPQRWHEILTEAAEARAAKRTEQQRRNNEAAQSVMLVSTASIVSLVG
ncbi:hypothetical protein B7G68_06835 [Caulobacter segnis]|uniref:Uncharacterized protein n=2 Tax=Caulobacter segnis TaxID=88688 RepID=D5VFU3_CAUST|nr:hypothetical protein [Caulobacter segnis]ADG09825.1 hypothetical protein Cseg_1330 [Caulobacter segnis ATCC 21756]AVQ01589.1 hypothetical protein B7G68_06835 [Caulobacter segnis]